MGGKLRPTEEKRQEMLPGWSHWEQAWEAEAGLKAFSSYFKGASGRKPVLTPMLKLLL